MLAKKILNKLSIFQVLKFIYWLWLELDARTMAEMPQVKYYARKKADKYRPF